MKKKQCLFFPLLFSQSFGPGASGMTAIFKGNDDGDGDDVKVDCVEASLLIQLPNRLTFGANASDWHARRVTSDIPACNNFIVFVTIEEMLLYKYLRCFYGSEVEEIFLLDAYFPEKKAFKNQEQWNKTWLEDKTSPMAYVVCVCPRAIIDDYVLRAYLWHFH